MLYYITYADFAKALTCTFFILPLDSNGYRVYPYPINYPIIINGYNVIDVVEMENGIGVIDPFGNALTDSECEEISLELKITAVNKESRTEKTIPLPNSIYRRNQLCF